MIRESLGDLQKAGDSARIEELVLAAQKGDGNAFSVLYVEHVEKVYRYIYMRVGQVAEAEDLTQEVFLHALKAIASYHERGGLFVSWLLRIAHNLIIDHYRKQKGRQVISLSEAIEGTGTIAIGTDPALTTEQHMELMELKQTVDKLPPRERGVIALRFGAELSVSETARVIGKAEGTVKKLQHEAVVKLRKLMNKGV
jgi:RNA polymerase sigma-70 factor (ECF subfamily)